MSGQFEKSIANFDETRLTTNYWLLTPYSTFNVHSVYTFGNAGDYTSTVAYGVRPSLNLKSNVQITSGTGTKSNPFVVTLGS